MSFEVQDPDAPTTTANAYISVATFKAYHDDRGGDYSAFSDTDIEESIVRVRDYVDTRWTFAGYRQAGETQSTECPRSGVKDQRTGYWLNGYPPELEEACAEYTMSALAGSLYPSPNVDATGRAVKKTRKKAAVLEKETEYFNASQAQTWTAFPVADGKMVRTRLLASRRRTLGRG